MPKQERVTKQRFAGEVFNAIREWWKEGDSPLSPGALLFDDDTTIGEAVRNANGIDLATPEQIAEARKMFQTDDIEIDDFDVRTSEGEDGVWVSAWVFVGKEPWAPVSLSNSDITYNLGTVLTEGDAVEIYYALGEARGKYLVGVDGEAYNNTTFTAEQITEMVKALRVKRESPVVSGDNKWKGHLKDIITKLTDALVK